MGGSVLTQRRRGATCAKKAWPMVRLGDVCEIRAGATHHGIESETGPYPVYGSGGYICQATEYRCPANTVTVGRKGTLDKPLLIEEPFWNIDTCFGVIPNESLDARYLWRFCQNFDFYSLIPSIGRPSTNSEAIKLIQIPLPPLSVQREIVARLEKELGEADALAAKFKEIAENADAEFKAELDETFKNVEGEKVRLGDVCEILDSRRVPITKKDRVAGEIPYYGATGIVDYVSSYIFDERLVLLGEDGARWGANEVSAFIIEGKSWVNNHAHVLRVRDNIADEYLVYYLNFANLSRYITGVTVPKLNQQRMKEIPIPLSPLSVQRAIVGKLDSAKDKCEKLKVAAERGLRAAEDLRKAILAEAFEQ